MAYKSWYEIDVVVVMVEHGDKHMEVLEVVYTDAEELEMGCIGTDAGN